MASLDTTETQSGVADKRSALLKAALELLARDGLQRVPTSAIAKRAGVAKGTLFAYFETKEQLINELYLEIVDQYIAAVTAAGDPAAAPKARLRSYWFAFARWYLDHRAASNVMLQCEASSALTAETQARKEEMEAEMVRSCFPDSNLDQQEPLYRHVVHAMTAGPIQVLAHMQDKGAVEITNELLEETFARVERALISDERRDLAN